MVNLSICSNNWKEKKKIKTLQFRTRMGHLVLTTSKKNASIPCCCQISLRSPEINTNIHLPLVFQIITKISQPQGADSHIHWCHCVLLDTVFLPCKNWQSNTVLLYLITPSNANNTWRLTNTSISKQYAVFWILLKPSQSIFKDTTYQGLFLFTANTRKM